MTAEKARFEATVGGDRGIITGPTFRSRSPFAYNAMAKTCITLKPYIWSK